MSHKDVEHSQQPAQICRRRSKLHIVVVSVGLISLGAVLGVVAAASTSAFAGMGSHFPGHHGPVTLEQMQERAGNRLDWILGALDASDDQATQIKAIGLDLAAALYPLKQQHRDNKRQFMAQLIGPNPDPATLEELRRRELGLADIASAKVLAAVLQGGNTLSQEQRDKLAQHLRHHRR